METKICGLSQKKKCSKIIYEFISNNIILKLYNHNLLLTKSFQNNLNHKLAKSILQY